MLFWYCLNAPKTSLLFVQEDEYGPVDVAKSVSLACSCMI